MRMLARALSLLSLVLGLFGLAAGGVLAEPQGLVVQVPVTGVINPVQASYVARALDRAEQQGASAVVLLLDTPGGLDSSMRQIVQSILGSRVPVIVYVSPPGARAGSAGVYITYAAHVAAMAPNTNIGSATPVAIGGGGEAEMSEEMKAKVTNDAVAFIRGLAERRGRNVEWAEQAVREGANVTASQAVRLNVVDLQASSLDELLERVDGRTVEVAGGQTVLRTAGSAVEPATMTGFESFLHAISDPTIAYLLLSLGSLGLMMELYNPGAIFPGVVGGLCLLLALFALGTLPVNYAGLLLMAFGLLLFVADIFSPTNGILTAGGIIAFLFGSFMLFDAPASQPYLQVSLIAIGAVAVLLIGFFGFAATAAARGHRRKVVTGREGLIGRRAEVRTRLAPEGYVHLDGELWRARSSGRPVEVGESVTVVGIEGLLLSVTPESAVVGPAMAATTKTQVQELTPPR